MVKILSINKGEDFNSFEKRVETLRKKLKREHKKKVTTSRMSGYNNNQAKFLVKVWS